MIRVNTDDLKKRSGQIENVSDQVQNISNYVYSEASSVSSGYREFDSAVKKIGREMRAAGKRQSSELGSQSRDLAVRAGKFDLAEAVKAIIEGVRNFIFNTIPNIFNNIFGKNSSQMEEITQKTGINSDYTVIEGSYAPSGEPKESPAETIPPEIGFEMKKNTATNSGKSKVSLTVTTSRADRFYVEILDKDGNPVEITDAWGTYSKRYFDVNDFYGMDDVNRPDSLYSDDPQSWNITIPIPAGLAAGEYTIRVVAVNDKTSAEGEPKTEMITVNDVRKNYYQFKNPEKPAALGDHDQYYEGIGTVNYKVGDYYTTDYKQHYKTNSKGKQEFDELYGEQCWGAVECWGYANNFHEHIYDTNKVSRFQINYEIPNLKSMNLNKLPYRPDISELNKWREEHKDELESYEKKVKAAIIAAGIGSHIRTEGHVQDKSTEGHSFIITGISEDGIEISQANGTATSNLDYTDKNPKYSKNVVTTAKWTWEEYFNSTYTDSYGYRGIDFTRNYYTDANSGLKQAIMNLVEYNDMTIDEAVNYLKDQKIEYDNKNLTMKNEDWEKLLESL